MKHTSLKRAAVKFDAAEHKYYRESDGKELQGITQYISKYIYKDMMYEGIPESVLESAKERGSNIHSQLDMHFNGFDCAEMEKETVDCIELLSKNKFNNIASEYLVTDNEYLASSIDAVFETPNGIAIVDYKTTSELHTEYLRWQLSVYKYFFEMMNKDIEDVKIYAVHLPKGKSAKLVEIKPISNDDLMLFFKAIYHNEETFDNPLRNMGDNFKEILDILKQANKELADVSTRYNELNETISSCKEELKAIMDSHGTDTWSNEDGTIKVTRSADTYRKSFSLETLQQNSPKFPKKWMNELEKGYTNTVIPGRLTVTIK